MTDPETPSEPTILRSMLHPRREAFEYGILPIPKLVFNDPIQTLGSLKQKIASQSPSCRVDSATLADALQITPELGKLVIDTLSSVHHSDSDHFIKARGDGVDEVEADVRDILLFLFIQSYKKLLPRPYKDPAAVADVWPSTSAFDGCLSAMSPLQLARSNSRRFMPSQIDEEAHQLSYLQKHLQNLLALLAEISEGEGENSKILTMENFEHLGLLMHFCDKESEEISIKQAAPFFTKPDPDKPAAVVPVAQVHDWLMENIASALEHITERVSHKENGPSYTSDQDMSITPAKPPASSRDPCFIEGISKSSLLKQASELKGSSVKVLNCHDSVVYILAPLRYATVYGCSDSTIVLGAVGKAVRVEHCERVHVIVAAKRVCIANCRECIFYLGVNQQPLIVGDNHKLQLAPYNTFYSRLGEHMTETGIDVNVNKWNEPLTLGIVDLDQQDSSSHPAGVSDAQAEPATHLDPDQFSNFLIPSWFGGEPTGSTHDNPFHLPAAYIESQQKFRNNLDELKQAVRDTPLVESRKRELSSAIHVYFKDWLYASGNVRQLYGLQGD